MRRLLVVCSTVLGLLLAATPAAAQTRTTPDTLKHTTWAQTDGSGFIVLTLRADGTAFLGLTYAKNGYSGVGIDLKRTTIVQGTWYVLDDDTLCIDSPKRKVGTKPMCHKGYLDPSTGNLIWGGFSLRPQDYNDFTNSK